MPKAPLNAPNIFSGKIWKSSDKIDPTDEISSCFSNRRDINREKIEAIRVKPYDLPSNDLTKSITSINSSNSTEKTVKTADNSN